MIVDTYILNMHPFYVIGRQPPQSEEAENFILFEHPSLSRKHAILQINQQTKELFVYDLGSTHGTFVNKKVIKPKTYTELNEGDLLQFGESSRLVWVHRNTQHESSSQEDNEESRESSKEL